MRLRRRSLPRAVRRSLHLAAGERVLATGRGADDSYIVATNHALHTDGRRVPYDEIVRAVWDGETETLDVWEAAEPSGPRRITLAAPGWVPETVRERVQATIVISRHVAVRGDRGVVLTARRSPSNGQVRWTMMFDSGLDSSDPVVRTAAEAALVRVRDQAGI